MDVQLAFGSDILMALDECPEYPVSQEYARESMQRTVRWAREADGHFRRRMEEAGSPQKAADYPTGPGGSPQKTMDCPTGHALFPIVQGSMFADLRRECAAALVDLDADGYAIGGLSVGEPRPLSLEMVEATEDILPRDRPRYAMGVGMPAELAEYVARGHRHDGLRAALPQRAQRVSVHFGGARHHQTRALQGRRSGPWTKSASAILVADIPEHTYAICSSPGRFCTRYWRHGTTSGGTLTSCVGSGTL